VLKFALFYICLLLMNRQYLNLYIFSGLSEEGLKGAKHTKQGYREEEAVWQTSSATSRSASEIRFGSCQWTMMSLPRATMILLIALLLGPSL
jgi:hypothetical protein